jgi:hypothetical protein
MNSYLIEIQAQATTSSLSPALHADRKPRCAVDGPLRPLTNQPIHGCIAPRAASGSGVPEMCSFQQFNAFAASRDEGLHPKLRALPERAAKSPFWEVSLRHDGLVQAGPDPESEIAPARVNVVLFSR